ncbi:hypothetical protein QO179_03680 [Bacillus stercoris]|nr:hypothetical protein [Bacillus stercoris]
MPNTSDTAAPVRRKILCGTITYFIQIVLSLLSDCQEVWPRGISPAHQKEGFDKVAKRYCYAARIRKNLNCVHDIQKKPQTKEKSFFSFFSLLKFDSENAILSDFMV